MKRLSAFIALLTAALLCAIPATAATTPLVQGAAPASAAQAPPESYTQAGKGNAALENVEIKNHLAAARFTHTGAGAFTVSQTKLDGTIIQLVNASGKYDATVAMDTASPSKLQINADGDWTVALNPGVYWGDTGLKYHIDPECISFQGTTPNLGTIAEAQLAGRIGWCMICSDGMGGWNSTYAGAPTAVSAKPASGTPSVTAQSSEAASPKPTQSVGRQIYRTKTGKKYHYKNPCGRGTYYPCTLEEAQAAGLGPCEKCVN